MKKSLLVLSCVAYSVAWGSGFQVLEQGASNIGTATAGATVNANEDASAAFWNPSAVMFTDYTTKVDGALSVIMPNFHFSNMGTQLGGGMPVSGNDGGNGGKPTPVPNMYVAYKFNEEWALTLSVSSPYGLETRYDDGWVGRYHALKSKLFGIDFNPAVAYKPFDWISFSIGASANYVDAELTSAYTNAQLIGAGLPDGLATLKGDSWSGGANFGMTIKYAENGRIGFSYRSQIDHTLTGTMKVTHPVLGTLSDQNIKADLTTPNSYTIGFYQRGWDMLEDFAIMADYAFTQWSSFDCLDIKNSSTGQTVSYTDENWKNTSRVAIGMHYYLTDDLTLRLGVAWDESPVRSAYYRTPRIPDSDRIWFSTGIGYNLDGLNIELGYTYIMFKDVMIDSPAYDPATKTPTSNIIKGSFEGGAHVVSLQLGCSW